jgi:hypothetical protein
MIKHCLKCSIEHNKPGIFCSRSCANSRGPRTDEFKKLVSQKLTGRKGKDNFNKGKYLVERLEKKCLTCNRIFLTTVTESKKYCSNNCWKQQSGGYRSGSGRSKSGYYKGIYCGSTYELCWVIYNLDHNIKFSRFDGFLEDSGSKYYPDFILDDNKTIVEIKGFEKQESVDRKTRLAESFGYIVKVLRQEDLKWVFEYVKKKYSDKFYTLYDDYKPNYTYTCSFCKNEFKKDRKLKTNTVFCSRQCAGKGHKGRINKSL